MKQQIKLNLSLCLLLTALTLINTGCVTSNIGSTSDVFFNGPIVSCGHLIIYQLSEDNKSYLQVIINTKKVELHQENIWSISSENDNITVRFRQFEEEIVTRLCNDVGGKKSKPTMEVIASMGKLKLNLTEADWKNYKNGIRYKVDINASGLKFNNDSSYALSISQATVGWLPG